MTYSGDKLIDSVVSFGRATLLKGAPGTGKTLLALQAVRRTLRAKLPVVYVDFGGVLDAPLSADFGIPPNPEFHLFTYIPAGDLTGQIKVLQKTLPDKGLIVLDGVECSSSVSGRLAAVSIIWTNVLPTLKAHICENHSVALLATGTATPGRIWDFSFDTVIELAPSGFSTLKNRFGAKFSGTVNLDELVPGPTTNPPG